MSAKAKIVFAGVNLLCFVYTLTAPSQITFFAVVPTIMSGMSWLFASQGEINLRRPVQYSYIILYVIAAAICLLLGLSTEITLLQGEIGHYVLRFKEDIMLLANKTFEYWPVAILIAIAVFGLIIAEVKNDIKTTFTVPEPTISIARKVKIETQEFI